MSENETLTFDEITQFLDDRVPIQQCPSCSGLDWTIVYQNKGEDTNTVYGALVIPVGAPLHTQKGHFVQTLPVGRPILPLVCNNCAFMRFFDLATVKSGVKEIAKKGGEDGDST